MKLLFGNQRSHLWISIAFILALIVFTRISYYLYYPVVSISFDTASYCAVALNITEGSLPRFDIRTPGYPLFLSLIWFFSKNLAVTILLQTISTMITSIIFLVVINRIYKKHIMMFAAALAIYVTSSYFILYETALLAECLFVNLLILNSALLISAVKEMKPANWFYYSLSAGLLLYLRPAGLFILIVFPILILLFIKKRLQLKFYFSLIAPVIALVLALSTYNLLTVNSFSMSPFGNINLPGATITFMEKSDDYPGFVNETIDSVTNKIPSKDRQYVRSSFGFTKLYNIFLNNFYLVIVLTDKLIAHDSTGGFISVIPYLKEISFDAVKKHPDIYAKFFICNFVQFFRNTGKTLELSPKYAGVYKSIAIDQRHYKALEKGGWQQVSTDENDYSKVASLYRLNIARTTGLRYFTADEESNVKLSETFIFNIYNAYEKIYNLLFRNLFWVATGFLVFAFSAVKFFKSKMEDRDALLFVLFGLMYGSKAIMVSLVESSLERYSFSVEYILYMSIPFLYILIKNSKKTISE